MGHQRRRSQDCAALSNSERRLQQRRISPAALEGDILVVHRWRCVHSAAHPAARVIHRTRATAEELDRLRDDFRGRALAAAVLRIVLPRRNPPLDVHLPPLFKILSANFRELAPRDDSMPFRALLPRPAAIVEGLGRRDREIRYALARRDMPYLGIAPEVADE